MVQNVITYQSHNHRKGCLCAQLESLPHIKQVLVATDEKGISVHDGSQARAWGASLKSMYYIKQYYKNIAKIRNPDLEVPYFAVGCLGCTAAERIRLWVGSR